MAKFLLLALFGVVAYLFWKKMQSGTTVRDDRATPAAVLKRPLNEAQQALFLRLQNALPSTLIMVQPAVTQLVHAPDLDTRTAATLVDFAVCRKDSSPLGVVQLDAGMPNDALEQYLSRAGLKVVRFKSSALPTEQQIRDAFGFL